MNIIVCIKQILDPNIPPAKFKLDSSCKTVLPPEGIPPVINPYDEQAIELAVRLKEKHGGKITILTISNNETATTVLRHALSMGADDGIVVTDKVFNGSDAFALAYILIKAIEKIGSFDLILCGRQAADWDEGVIGSIIAENNELPLVTLAKEVDVVGEELKITRVTLNGYQVFSSRMPAVITVSNEVGQPRLPSGWGIISAAKKQVQIWDASTIGVDQSKVGINAAKQRLISLSIPSRQRTCEIIEGGSITESAISLALKLREAKII